MDIEAIGEVESKFEEPVRPNEMKEHESTIIIKPDYEEGLYKIKESNYLQILFYLDLAEGYDLKSDRFHGGVKGLFGSRSPRRPSPIGLTTVELLNRDGRRLRVYGLDAVDGTPVLDIKPYAPTMDEPGNISEEDLKENPRKEIKQLIKTGNREKLLLKAGELHGHYCPYLSLGVRAGIYAIREMGIDSEGMEDVVSIVETNSCFSDGVQYSTGCTLGNNSLIYRDLGKTAVTIAKRNGEALRIRFKEEENLIEEKYPESKELFDKVIKEREGDEEDQRELNERWSEIAFGLMKSSVDNLFEFNKVDANIPDYAPIFNDEICDNCGEEVMKPKTVRKDGKNLCIICADSNYFQLDGRGINKVEDG